MKTMHQYLNNKINMIRLLLVMLLGLSPGLVGAEFVEDLFEVEIPVPDEDRYSRHVALSDGLAEILVRVSGNSQILQQLKPPSPGPYVKQFRYLNNDNATQAGSSQPDEAQAANPYKLWVQYNGTMIMNLLRQQSVPVWGQHRNKAVIWVAVNDGTSRYILRNRDYSLIKKGAEQAFKRRGIPVIWPENDARDQQAINFADIWAGFADPLLQSSSRYSSGPVVAANMLWNGRIWSGDWTVIIGSDSRRWNLREADYEALIARGVDLLADAMGDKYAVLEMQDDGNLQQILVEVDHVDSVASFRKVENYLSSLRVVHSVRLSQIEPERVAFWLSLRSGVEDFLRLIKAGSEIEFISSPVANDSNATSNSTQNFVYRFNLIRS